MTTASPEPRARGPPRRSPSTPSAPAGPPPSRAVRREKIGQVGLRFAPVARGGGRAGVLATSSVHRVEVLHQDLRLAPALRRCVRSSLRVHDVEIGKVGLRFAPAARGGGRRGSVSGEKVGKIDLAAAARSRRQRRLLDRRGAERARTLRSVRLEEVGQVGLAAPRAPAFVRYRSRQEDWRSCEAQP